jgi:hypothetical protein
MNARKLAASPASRALVFPAVVLLASGLAACASVPPATSRHATAQATPSLPPDQAGLETIAGALGGQEGAYSATYSNLAVSDSRDQVILYATSATQAAAMIAAAKRAHPAIDTHRIRYVHADFTHAAITAEMDAIMASASHPGPGQAIYSAEEMPDGNGILVTAKPSAVGTLRAGMLRTDSEKTGIPITVTAGSPIVGAGAAAP